MPSAPSLAPLTAARIVDVADAGRGVSLPARATLLLAEALAGVPEGELDDVDVATRDALLLELRCATLGDSVQGRLWCPVCGSQLAVRLEGPSLHRSAPAADAPAAVRVALDGWTAEARSPDGHAMRAAGACRDVRAARGVLLERCVSAVAHEGVAREVGELPDAVVEALGAALVARDPGLDVRIGVTCAACEHPWRCCFDAGTFLWLELDALAVRILDEVHTLATGYGWTEDEVLQLSSRRRHHYVERLAGA